jgi:glutamate 5-kinase
MSKPVLSDLRRLVVKIGSTLLIDAQQHVNRNWLENLADDINSLRETGCEVLIVSSGAVAIGSLVLGINPGRSRLEELQAAAAAGQVKLVHAYQDALARHNIKAAQILLTFDDTEVKSRFLNARGTLEKLLEHGVVPVINENDTVATEELRYGDNDRLAARVAQTVMADGLILLSDVDGFYTSDPRANPDACYLDVVEPITDEHLRMAGGTGSSVGSGGMFTKIQAARIATQAGCTTIIADGALDRPLRTLFAGARHTVFPAVASPASARKQWLAGVLEVSGELRLDAGAVAALATGKSLLPVGIVEVVGQFRRGDAVMLVAVDGAELGRGLAAYSSDETAAIRGRHTDRIEEILGYRGRSVLVHRDDMVLFDRTRAQ